MFKLSPHSDGVAYFAISVHLYANADAGLILKTQSLHVCQMENKKRILLFLNEVNTLALKA